MEPSELSRIRAAVESAPKPGAKRLEGLPPGGELGRVDAAIEHAACELQRLKSELLALGAKASFLDAVAGPGGEDGASGGFGALFPAQGEMADVEIELAREKATLRSVKRGRAEQEALLRERAEAFAAAQSACTAAHARVVNHLAACDLDAQRRGAQRVIAAGDALPGLPEFLRAHPRLQAAPAALLLNRLALDIELREDIDAGQKREQSTLRAVDEKERELSQLHAELDNVLHDVEQHERSNPQSHKLRAAIAKADMQAQVEQALSGVQVEQDGECAVVMKVATAAFVPDENAAPNSVERHAVRIEMTKDKPPLAARVVVTDPKGAVLSDLDLAANGLATPVPDAASIALSRLVSSQLGATN